MQQIEGQDPGKVTNASLEAWPDDLLTIGLAVHNIQSNCEDLWADKCSLIKA